MPIPPHPMTYRCKNCGWSKTTAPRSDALMPGDFFDACPKCGDTSLEKSPADLATATALGITRKLKELLR